MTTYTLDTAKTIASFTDSGMPEQQAKVVVEAIAESHEQLATKTDIELLRKDLESSDLKTRIWTISGLVTTIAVIKALDKLFPMLGI